MQNGVGLDSLLSKAVTTAVRYISDANADNTALFEDACLCLLRALTTVEPTARLSLSSPLVSELLNHAPSILSTNHCSASTRSKMHRLLFNIALHNVKLRRYMAHDLELCSHIFHCLKLSLKEQLGPQNMIDILRLMQVLTYERTIILGIWANELISFLMGEVNREDEMEWMPYCIVILCNLSARSKSVCNRIKKSSTYKIFCRRVMKLLSHDSSIVVVSSLVLVGYLEERVRDMVYSSPNIKETFKCVFNILVMGDRDCLMTRHIAADLLRRMVVSDAPSVSSVPVITTTGKDVMHYSFFENSIQRVADLLVSMDARGEESMKVYDLLLSFCSLPLLRPYVCRAILSCPSSESRLTTPTLAILKTSRMTADQAIDPYVPIKAMRLLTYLCKEMVDQGTNIAHILPLDHVVPLIEYALKTSVDTSSPDSMSQCQLVVEGLRLAEACAHEEDLRSELLDKCSPALVSHIMESQLLTNPIVLQMSKPPAMRVEKLPEWSLHGVAIILELIRVLAVLKDHNKAHKVQYWNSLKDERLVPFLAYAIANGDHEMVHDALLLYTHCAQVHNFPSRGLGDLIASCSIAKQHQIEHIAVSSLNNTREIKRYSPEQMDCSEPRSPDHHNSSVNRDSNRVVDELLDKIKKGYEVRDLKMTDVLAAYQKKIDLLEIRERDLESVISSSERLRMNYKTGAGTSEADLARIRSLVEENENLREKTNVLVHDMQAQKHASEKKMNEVLDEVVRIRGERDELANEIEHERALVIKAKTLAEEHKKRLEIASQTVVVKNKEIEDLKLKIKGLSDDIIMLNRKYDVDMDKLKRENELLTVELDNIRCRGQKTQADLDKMKKLREEMLRLAGGYD